MIFKAVILGIVEGLTEFLPVSSTGHLIIANRFFGFEGAFEAVFDIVIQTGAILAVVVYFREELFPSFGPEDRTPAGRKKVFEKWVQKSVKLWKLIIIAFIPAAVIGVFIADLLELYLFNTTSVGIALIAGAFLMLIAEKVKKTGAVKAGDAGSGGNEIEITAVTVKQAIIIGFFQCLAMWPGMSRSASTIAGGLFAGLRRPAAAEFSFLLGIPTIIGASVYKLLKTGLILGAAEWAALAVGTIVSFVVAFFVVKLFMNYIKTRGLLPFVLYRIALGVILLVLF